MPLAFHSLSHGTVAFGFFNIDSDMLLLEQDFFFASDFCRAMEELATAGQAAAAEWGGYRISMRADVGDLMGAIHAVRYSGFIGETYKRFPFPARAADFKQKPEGFENRELFAGMIERFGEATSVRLACARDRDEAEISDYRFARAEFHRLVDYVWLGGYPRWRDGERPDYVERMIEAIRQSKHWLFEQIQLSE